jgi:hypothetical protein
LMVALMLAGCGGDSTTGPLQNGAMSATINGASWTSSQGATVTRTSGGGASILSIGGSDGTLSVGMAWTDNGVGTYPITSTSSTNVFLTTGSAGWAASLIGGSGSITVTTVNATHVVGTFNFVAPATPGTTATGTKTATNGQFDINF